MSTTAVLSEGKFDISARQTSKFERPMLLLTTYAFFGGFEDWEENRHQKLFAGCLLRVQVFLRQNQILPTWELVGWR